MITRRWLALAIALSVAACASNAGSGGTRSPRDMTVLKGPELQSQAGITLFDQIQRVRPNWLRIRGASSLTRAQDIVVYRDGVRQGGVAILREFTVDTVEMVQFLSGPEAASRFGLDHQHGAILVTSRKS